MRLVTEREQIKKAVPAWFKQYADFRADYTLPDQRKVGEIRTKLAALDPETCSREQLDAAGLDGWGTNECDECNRNMPILLRYGSEPDYDTQWQDLCADCLRAGLEKLACELVS
jgi:hypothetical protein